MASSSASAAKSGSPATVSDYVLEHHIGFLLRRAHQRHASIFNEQLGAHDLTPTQFAALIKAIQLGRVTQNHLGRLTAMDPATIQGVVRRLTERGLMRREIDPLDRRSAVLSPTEEALPVVASAIAAVRSVADLTLTPLSPAERIELARLLGKIG
jgi:DNA-binding MarR family transcriptional regulator